MIEKPTKERQPLDEKDIVERVRTFLITKERGNWHEEKAKVTELHQRGVDLIMIGGKRNSECFFIECKGKSYARSERSINKEGWLNALGQIVTRMSTPRIIKSGQNKGEVNRAYKYGLGLYWVSAQTALRRIPKEIATTLNLHIFSVNDNGEVKQFTPSMFGKKYDASDFNVTKAI